MKRNFNLNDVNLYAVGNHIYISMENNLEDFEKFGITQGNLDEFKQLLATYMAMPGGDLLRYDTMIVREGKDELKLALSNQLNDLAIRFKLLWGEYSPEYRELGIVNIRTADDERLLVVAKNLSKSVEANFAALQTFGLTTEIAEAFENSIVSFENKVLEFEKAKLTQKRNTESKVMKGNELYQLVKKYSRLGKSIYEKTDSSKYKNFVIFRESMGTLAKPENFVYDSVENCLKWEHVTRAVSYRVEFSEDGENFVKLKSTRKEFLPLEEFPSRKGFYRLKARNMQNYGPYSEVLEVE